MLRMLSDICNLQAGMMKNGLLRDDGFKKINNKGLEMADWPLYLGRRYARRVRQDYRKNAIHGSGYSGYR